MFIEIDERLLNTLSKHYTGLSRQLYLMANTVISDDGKVIKNRKGNQTDVTVEMAQLMRRIEEIV